MCPTIYAELLRSLGQVSIYIELTSPADNSTRLELQQQGTVLSLKHGAWNVTLELPAAVKLSSPTQLTIPPGIFERSLKLLLLDPTIASEGQDNYVPWTAPQLSNKTSCFQCASCHHEVITPGATMIWKDLPSHNWADMMDFWHCHKPTETQGPNVREKRTHGDGRGIGGYVVQEGVGLVDLTFVLVNQKDCSGGLRVTQKTISESDIPEGSVNLQPILCTQCGSQLGVGEVGQSSELGEETWKLNKWNLALSGRTDKLVSYNAECFLSAQLMSIIDEQAVRRFRLLTESENLARLTNNAVGLRLWVFHTDRPYSSTTAGATSPVRAMKVYYLVNVQPDEPAPAGLEEEIVVTDECMAIVVETLQRSTSCLPISMRRFRSWNAGMLPRFAQDA
ncbi:ubiquitin-conjugating enzyme E2-binding protein [Peziza echinospora]|nr:ubiquitin-conjugating enzyme E2-binding protein [Peziza echinospora]